METTEITTERDNRHPSRGGHGAARTLGLGVAGLLAVYLVVRGVVEFFTVDYSDPASYRGDWGGPSLAGVLAVHSGPAAVIVTAAGIYLRRRWRAGREHVATIGAGSRGPASR
jgi:hypothetical protein